jgi:acyl-CoA thioester hydrolase
MYTTETNIRVRYGETDQMGYAYYANYALYFEVGRTEMLRSLGFTYREWEEKGILLPVKSLSIDYISPARYDDLLTIRTTVIELPSARITFGYEVLNEKKQLICTGRTVLVFVDAASRRPSRPPESFLAILKKRSATS